MTFHKGDPKPPTSGRKKGVRNKMPSKPSPVRMVAEAVAASQTTGELPLDYMLRVMRDPKVESTRRDAMAKAAAPYLHAALASTQVRHANADGSPVGPQLTQVFLDTTGKPVEKVDMTQTTAPEKGKLN